MTANWEAIETFTVESATGNNNLYANGRQCIRIRMAIKAIDINSQPVELTEKERLTITLVNFHGGKPLKYTRPESIEPLDSTKEDKWDWSIQNIGDYEHFPSGHRTSSVSDEVAHTQGFDTAYIDFYIRTVDFNPLTVAARITREDGKVFYSRNMDGGRLVLRPVRPTSYRASDYYLEKTVIVPFRNPGARGGIACLYYFEFGLKAARDLQFRTVTCAPGGLHDNIAPVIGHYEAGMVGYVRPGQKTINYLFPLTHVSPDLQGDARSGRILFTSTYVVAADRRRFGEVVGRTPVFRSNIQAMDEYGNEHRVQLRFKPNGNWGDLEIV